MAEVMSNSENDIRAEPAPPPQQITVETSVTLDPVYANHVLIAGLQHEALIDFFQIVPSGPGEGISQHVGRILMPLSLLKGFHAALGEQIANYEADGRAIPNLRDQSQ